MKLRQNDFLHLAGKFDLLTAEEEIYLSRQVQEAIQLRSEKKSNYSFKEKTILRKGDRARDRMITSNMKLADHFAKKYIHLAGPSMDIDDFRQEAVLGIERAIQTFDGTRGYKFSTYASRWIRHHIQRYIQRYNKNVKIPIHLADKMYKMSKVHLDLRQELGRSPTTDEMAKRMVVSIEDLNLLLIRGKEYSMDHKLPASEDKLDLHGCVGELDQFQLEEEESKNFLASVLDCLPPIHKEIIERNFGLNDRKPQAKRTIIKEMNISQTAFNEMFEVATRRIKEMLETGIVDYKFYPPLPEVDEDRAKEINSMNKRNRIVEMIKLRQQLMQSGMTKVESICYTKRKYGLSPVYAETKPSEAEQMEMGLSC